MWHGLVNAHKGEAAVSSLDSSLVELVDCYWVQFFGCSPAALRSEAAQIVAHAELGDYAGCYLMEFGAALLCHCPSMN